MTSAECNLIKPIPGAPSEQRELLDLKRSHLEEKYPLLLQSMLGGGSGCCLGHCWLLAQRRWRRLSACPLVDKGRLGPNGEVEGKGLDFFLKQML